MVWLLSICIGVPEILFSPVLGNFRHGTPLTSQSKTWISINRNLFYLTFDLGLALYCGVGSFLVESCFPIRG